MKPIEPAHVEALRMLEDIPNACRVLDAPAGNARMAERLALNGHTVVCGDVLAPPASLPANVRYQQMDLNEPLPFPDESFDVVVSNEGLQYIRRPYDLIHEFGRVLRPGGVLVLTMPNLLHVLSRYRFLTHGNYPAYKDLYRPRRPDDWNGPALPVSPFSYQQLVYAAGWSGLGIEEVGVCHLKWSRLLYAPLIAWIKFVWLFAGRAYRRRRHVAVVNSLPVLLADGILIKARKTTGTAPLPSHVRWPAT